LSARGGLRRLNFLSPESAEAELREVCGAPGWAAAVAAGRPFQDEDALAAAAEAAWDQLPRAAWIEGFAAHPRIGEGNRHAGGEASEWSREEQAGMSAAAEKARAALAAAQRAYERRFGWPYIVCATGRSATEMLADCRARLTNDPDGELVVAAGEERRIGRLRLEKLLTTEGQA
jgi:2-oxo-4-hydroxy-4-carboxy-5-ureidoimidazoline decarboxylase